MLFRAIGECPLSKGESYTALIAMGDNRHATELYLMAFGPLRSVFTPQELHAFSDTMAERQLRMRKGVDELGELEDVERVKEDTGDSDMDEIEHNAHELRRLRPY